MKDIPDTDTVQNIEEPECIPLQIYQDAVKNVICRQKNQKTPPAGRVESNLIISAVSAPEKAAYTKWWIHRIKLA
jgi:hypothetical protein